MNLQSFGKDYFNCQGFRNLLATLNDEELFILYFLIKRGAQAAFQIWGCDEKISSLVEKVKSSQKNI